MLNKTYKSTIVYGSVALAFILIFAAPSLNKMTFAYPIGYNKGMNEKGLGYGQIIGMVQDKAGKTEWLISGHFKTNVINSTQFSETNKALFDATLHMVKPEGIEKHMHEISNFVLKESTIEDNMPVYKGTVTVTMKNSPVNEVPITIKVDNHEVVNVVLDQSKLQNHFGDKPLFGIVFEPMKLQGQSMTTTGTTTLENKSSK
jgi:hypothetical protein